MSKTVQHKRGTTAQTNAYTGAAGEVTVDTDKDLPVVHDGLQSGGFAVAARANVDGSISLINRAGTVVASFSQDALGNLSPRLGSQGAISGDRNRVINGSCQIVNVASVAVGNGVQSAYGGPEMFPASNTGGGQFTQSQGSVTWEGLTLPTVRQTVNTANTDITGTNQWSGISHRFEGFNVFDLRGKPVAVSFVFNANVSGTYSVAVRDNGASQSYVASFDAVANTPFLVKIPVAAIPLAANIPNSRAQGFTINVGLLNTGTLQTPTLNAWQAANYVAATGATNWGATAGNYIELTNLQLEEGTVATDFIRRSYGSELALTQRYVFRFDAAQDESRQVAMGHFRPSTTVADLIGNMPVPMRANPTLTTSAASTFNLYSTAGAPVPTALGTATGATRTTFTLTATSPTAVTQGSGAMLALNTGAFIELSARL